MGARKDINKILIIGSGPIVIGQACEFDYSGVQAVKALKEEGYKVILVNPNPATVMTTPKIADVIYTEPLEPDFVEQILIKEKPDAILPTMGGQTALNLALKLDKLGILKKYNIKLLGASIEAIEKAEDRGKFKDIVNSIGLQTPTSALVKSLEEAHDFLNICNFPIIIRPSFTLGGRGGSISYSAEDFDDKILHALDESPVGETLIEESLIGWKEFELEVMRDKADNAVVICSIENIDPMGVHTGDSITVAPAQTLSDIEYQIMRKAAIDTLKIIGVDCGGSNVQFAINPKTGKMIIIEMNPRVSRSSALASKATGFPIARASAKLAVGFTLDEILNEITGKTVSCFEPTLDYVAVKIPRFELEKFPHSYDELGTQMKSVGETLALGRTFIEALNKAFSSIELKYDGLEELKLPEAKITKILKTQHPKRLLAAWTKILKGGEKQISYVNSVTGFDKWFLYQLYELSLIYKELKKGINKEIVLKAKQSGLSDKRIASIVGVTEKEIYDFRENNNINASYHFVDTCSGEFSAKTPYFYSTYGEEDEGKPLTENGKKSILILASGPNRIGQGLEFDTTCTLASLSYKKAGIKTIMVNSNPETVSTDFNVSDRLYIEPLTVESVKEIIKKEKVTDVVVQLGGQTPLNMSKKLENFGVNIVGTKVDDIYAVEDRGLFSKLVQKVGVRQPKNRAAVNKSEIITFANEIGFPVLLRPSFVIGGRAMFVAYNEDDIDSFLEKDIEFSNEAPILVDEFLEDAFEYDVDAICDGKNVYIAGIMEHIEAAGVHSGDSACVFPPYKSTEKILKEMKDVTCKLAKETKTIGFINVQFAAKNEVLYVLEVNPRASRSVPFIAKASGVNLVDAVVNVWCGKDLEKQKLTKNGFGIGTCKVGWAVKEAVFSFDRFYKVDPILGPEMKSTGEAIGMGKSFGEAYAKAQVAAGNRLPFKGLVFVSVHKKDRETILPVVLALKKIGFSVASTKGTAKFLYLHGIFSEIILKVHEGSPNVIDHMELNRFSLLINTPLGQFSQHGDNIMRIEAIKRKLPYTTTTSAAEAVVEAIKYLKEVEISAGKNITLFPIK